MREGVQPFPKPAVNINRELYTKIRNRFFEKDGPFVTDCNDFFLHFRYTVIYCKRRRDPDAGTE